MSSNETISSGDCSQSNQRNAVNLEVVLNHSLANNYLIIDNIFKWLSSSQVIECSKVCPKWRQFAQLVANKRQSFSQMSLYFGLLSAQWLLDFTDKYQNLFVLSFEEIIKSYNLFVRCNRLMDFNVILVFSKLNFNQMQQFVSTQSSPINSTIVHINCRNEIIGTRIQKKPIFDGIEAEPQFEQLSGISALFISTALTGIKVNLYKDSKIFDICLNDSSKCVLVFHIWRSLYGHFSRLKTDSEYVEHLEKCIQTCEHSLAFGGVTVERLICSESTSSVKSDKSIDYICCLTFSGPNLKAFSYVIDFNDNQSEDRLKSINEEISLGYGSAIETIGFVFDKDICHSIRHLKSGLKGPIKLVGCSGVSHGTDTIKSTDSSFGDKNIFFRKQKCVLVVIQLNKTLE